MNDEEEKQGVEEPLVNFRQLRKFVIYPLLAAFGLWLCYIWLVPAFSGFKLDRSADPGTAALVRQAKDAGLTYEKVLADPAGAEGKFVVWCVQNRTQTAVTVDGDENKRLAVSNYFNMPAVSGSKHQSCEPMLLLVEKKVAGRPVTVFFKEAL
jgi:hypothetical protein